MAKRTSAQLSTTPTPVDKSPVTKRTRQAGLSRQARRTRLVAAGGAGGAACVVLGLSVGHVASAIQALSGGSGTWASWAGCVMLAIGVDCGMVAAEVAWAVCDGCEEVATWARRVVWGTLGLSAVLNAWEFQASPAAQASWVSWGLCIGLGVLVPFLVFGLSRVATATWQSTQSR